MFKVGQKVICIHEDNSDVDNLGLDSSGPKLNDIVNVDWIGICRGKHCLGFKEYGNGDCWDSWQFRPLDETFATETIENLIQWNESQKVTV